MKCNQLKCNKTRYACTAYHYWNVYFKGNMFSIEKVMSAWYTKLDKEASLLPQAPPLTSPQRQSL